MASVGIKGIIWDVGNVLASFDHLKACGKLAEYCSLTPGDILQKLISEESAPAKLHEAGVLSPQKFFESARELLHFSKDLSFQEFSDIWKDIFQENTGVNAVVNKVRFDLSQCILSNTDPIHWLAIEKFPVLQKHFSNQAMLVRSYTSGTRKPDPKIYRDALRALSLDENDIEHVLYIDDIAEYRAAFKRMGGNVLSYDCSKDPISRLEDGFAEFGVLGTTT